MERTGNDSFFVLSLGQLTRGLAIGASDRQGRSCWSPSAFLGLLAVLEFFWSDDNKRKIVRGHLNRSFDNMIALVPWDKLTRAGTCGVTCLDQSRCALDRSLDWLQL